MKTSGNGTAVLEISFGPLCCGLCACPEGKRAIGSWERDGEVGTALCDCVCHLRRERGATLRIDSIGDWRGAHVAGFGVDFAYQPTFSEPPPKKNRGPQPKKNRRAWLRRP